MSRDDLRQRLRTADAHAPAAPLTDDLSSRVHRRLARRRQRQATAATLGVVILVGLGVFAILRNDPPRRHVTIPSSPTTTTKAATVPAHSAATATAAAADFAVTATLHELTAQKLLAAAADASPARRDAGVHATSSDAQLVRDRAALVLVYDADRDVRENRPAAARARYQRAIELFPHTHWAQVARQRLKEIQA